MVSDKVRNQSLMMSESCRREANQLDERLLGLFLMLYNGKFIRLFKIQDDEGRKIRVSDTDVCRRHFWLVAFGNLCNDIIICEHVFFVMVCSYYIDIVQDTSDRYYYLRCYSPRLIVTSHLTLQQSLSFARMMSIVRLIWEFLVRIHRREFQLDLVSFLISDVGDFMRALTNISLYHAAPEQQQQQQAEVNTKNNNDYDRGEKLNSPLLRIMYFEFKNPVTDKIELILRPNRTLAARKYLVDKVQYAFNLTLKITIGVCIAPTVSSLYGTFFESEYFFPNCPTDMLSGSFIIRTIGSICLGLMYFFDSVPSVVFAVGFEYVVISDLELYWQSIRNRLNKLKESMYLMEVRSRQNQKNTKREQHLSDNRQVYGQHCCCWPTRVGLIQSRLIPRVIASRISKERAQNMREIALIQAEVGDFFRLVRQADTFMSRAMLFAMIAWLTSNAFFTANELQLEQSYASLDVRIIQLFMLIVITSLSNMFLKFKRNIERAYGPICALMALDQNLNKRKWIPVVAFYTGKPRYAFTGLGGNLFTPLTYITFISYSITLVLYFESYKSP